MSTADWREVYEAEVRRWQSYRPLCDVVEEAAQQVAEVLQIEQFRGPRSTPRRRRPSRRRRA